MTLFFFQTLAFCSEVVYTLVPDAGQVAKNLKMSLFDCGAMTKRTLYALNQVRKCHIAPEGLENSQTKIILYTKHFRKKPNATKGRIHHQDTLVIKRRGTVDITTTAASITLELEILVT